MTGLGEEAGAKARGPGSGGPGVSVTDGEEVRLTRGDSRVSRGGRRRRAAWGEWGGGARLPGASGGGAAAAAPGAAGGQGHSWSGTLAGGALRPLHAWEFCFENKRIYSFCKCTAVDLARRSVLSVPDALCFLIRAHSLKHTLLFLVRRTCPPAAADGPPSRRQRALTFRPRVPATGILITVLDVCLLCRCGQRRGRGRRRSRFRVPVNLARRLSLSFSPSLALSWPPVVALAQQPSDEDWPLATHRPARLLWSGSISPPAGTVTLEFEAPVWNYNFSVIVYSEREGKGRTRVKMRRPPRT